ncbi:MAG: hypothetical protein QF613_00920 [Candidatus Marinimicrobia bacterium]|jgi:TolB-like protein|nr:hypothetical protein [Candidatus Neomarinimicrobiota bacterium]MDP6457040.1 hypothetical protein [Candidatus Neomarinimicrobiota bacterium]MDP6592760.1 hypothetical protein [Candidatus Neomarinimicrobiota bacterium]MDP6836281.1 hypothetical protein [Candidatus Neomarinimicrobiota bacterium]|tara:strand:- start:982 stop:2274 length:1293 start_codon:yes stop_codon:yes gene_type:complete
MKGIRQAFVLLLFVTAVSLLRGLAPAPRWLNLYILEFDNIKNEPSVQWLSTGFVDMLKSKFESIDGVRILGRQQMERILQDRSLLLRQKPGTRNVLLMGTFTRELDQVVVNVQLINIANWDELGKVVARGSLNRVPALSDDLFRKVNEPLKGQLPTQEPGTLKTPLVEAEPPQYSQQMKEMNFSLSSALENLEEAMDVYIGAREVGDGTVDSHGKFSRDFTFGSSGNEEVMPPEDVQMLEEILTRISSNPYQVTIGNPELEIKNDDSKMIVLTVPVKYSLRENLIKDMLKSLPYTGVRQKGSLTTIEFSRSKFPLPEYLNDRIKKGAFRTVPVIQLYDVDGRVRTVILDSTDPYWKKRKADSVNYVTEHIFSPLIVFTVGSWSLQVTMEAVDIKANYVLELPHKEVARYARVLVEFVPETELSEFLSELL